MPDTNICGARYPHRDYTCGLSAGHAGDHSHLLPEDPELGPVYTMEWATELGMSRMERAQLKRERKKAKRLQSVYRCVHPRGCESCSWCGFKRFRTRMGQMLVGSHYLGADQ